VPEEKVSVKVCVQANCEYLKVQAGDRLLHIPPAINCENYIEEARGKHKPTRYSRERRIYRRGVAGGWHYRDICLHKESLIFLHLFTNQKSGISITGT